MIWRNELCGFCVTAFCVLAVTARADEKEATEAVRNAGGTVRHTDATGKEKRVSLHLTNKEVTDEVLVHVAAIPNVAWLNLSGTKITDAGLANIANMKTLTRLHLELTDVGDAGLAHLRGLENLEYLNLYGTQVTDVGLAKLKGLKKLKKVYVWRTSVTPAGAETFAKTVPGLDVNIGIQIKPVTTISAQSSYHPRYQADRAVDGNTSPTHSWVSGKYGGGTTQDPKDTWWAINFGNAVKLKGVKIIGDQRTIIPLLKNFQIQASDGKTWQTIHEVKDARAKTTTTLFEKVVETRGIRILVLATDLPSDGMVRICELRPITPNGSESTVQDLEMN